MGREAKRRGERERKRKEKKRGQTGPNISIFFSLIRCKRWHITEAIIINHLFCLFLLCFLQYCEANDMQICFVFLTPTGDDPLRKRNGRGAEGGGNNSEEKKTRKEREIQFQREIIYKWRAEFWPAERNQHKTQINRRRDEPIGS